jgi:hypothetical protein
LNLTKDEIGWLKGYEAEVSETFVREFAAAS